MLFNNKLVNVQLLGNLIQNQTVEIKETCEYYLKTLLISINSINTVSTILKNTSIQSLNIVENTPQNTTFMLNEPNFIGQKRKFTDDLSSNSSTCSCIGVNLNKESELTSNSINNEALTNACEDKVKLLKNNKVVYVCETKKKLGSNQNKEKKKQKIIFVNRGKRGSKFRGVSKNGNQWQVLIMINKSKSYVGSYATEEIAARIYDLVSLKNHGIKAKTNFNYTAEEIKKMIYLDVKDKDIQEKIIHMFDLNSSIVKFL